MLSARKYFTFIISLLTIVIVLLLCNCCPKEVYVPRDFNSLSELEIFLKEDQTDKVVNPDWDCDDYSRGLQHNALQKGYLMDVQLVGGGRIGRESQHMICSCCVGNEMYFVEPTNDNIILMMYLDFPDE